MAKGNPNPSPATRFKKGGTANPGGKTKEHKKLEIEAAEMAARLRHAILSAMMEKLSDIADASELMSAEALRLLRDSEDRAHGTPRQSIEHMGEGGGDIVFRTIYERRGD